MGFQTNTASNVSPFASTQQRGNNDSWKADAFLNVYLPTKNGRRKVGYIPLKASRAFDKAIIDRFLEGGDEAMAAFLQAMEIDFHTAEADEDSQPVF